MSAPEGTRRLTIVSACMNADGTPTFALSEVEVTQDEADNGVQYLLAEDQLLADGYEEPFVHFDPGEAPAFLLPAVLEYLGRSPRVAEPTTATLAEEP
jgi:hypothetical protein